MWWRIPIALVLVLHGIVFAFLNPDSWLFDDGRGLYLTLGVIAAIFFNIGAVLLVLQRDSWRLFLAPGAALSLVQLLIFFEAGQFIGVAIDVAVLAAVAWTYWKPSTASSMETSHA